MERGRGKENGEGGHRERKREAPDVSLPFVCVLRAIEGREIRRKGGRDLEHGEVGAGEGPEVVGVAGGVEVEGEDGEDGHHDAQDRERVGHWCIITS